MAESTFQTLRRDLRALRDDLPALRRDLGVPFAANGDDWLARLERNVLPSLDFDLPVLLVAICGGGSTGKSTLLNSLVGEELAQVGFKAGLTARVMLVGHPSVLASPAVARALLHRLGEEPQPWRSQIDTVTPGPPLYATAESAPRNLLLIDTPDLDTGEGGQLVNRGRAEPLLRTADVIIYLFTNAVYNNLSNTRFMAQIVGAIGGRPTVLVYRISRTASDAEVLDHCRVVARNLYPAESAHVDGFPEEVIGLYRVHESDAVALGEAWPRLLPIGSLTHERPLADSLAALDIVHVKRHVLAADLAAIRRGAEAELGILGHEARCVPLYAEALEKTVTQRALEGLRSFPMGDALELALRLFERSSPLGVRLARGAAHVVSLPLRGAQAVGRWIESRMQGPPTSAEAPDPRLGLARDLLLAANALRNQMLADTLVVRVQQNDAMLATARSLSDAMRAVAGGSLSTTSPGSCSGAAQRLVAESRLPSIEPSAGGTYNVHVSVPQALQARQQALVGQDWEAVATALRGAADQLTGMPSDIEGELSVLVADFRAHMGWRERLREMSFASLSALPPLLAVSYTLLTADPLTGTGLWIKLQSLFGINDLWALVAIPASAGLSERDRRQLERLVAPVFRLWLDRRVREVCSVLERTVCAPLLAALARLPRPDDPRLAACESALRNLEAP